MNNPPPEPLERIKVEGGAKPLKSALELAQELGRAEGLCQAATAIRGIVAARVLMSMATPRERRLYEMAQAISASNGEISGSKLAEFLAPISDDE